MLNPIRTGWMRGFCVSALILSCYLPAKAQHKEKLFHQLNTLLINSVMEDLFTPPVAARIYVYPNIAFYECIRKSSSSFPSLAGKLNGLSRIPKPAGTIDPFIAACLAFSYVGQSLIATEYK